MKEHVIEPVRRGVHVMNGTRAFLAEGGQLRCDAMAARRTARTRWSRSIAARESKDSSAAGGERRYRRLVKTIAWINGYQVVRGGTRLRFDEAVVRTALSVEAVDLEVALGVGEGAATAYGCDLSKGYVDEKAAYFSS